MPSQNKLERLSLASLSSLVGKTSGLYYKKLTIVNEAEDYRIVMMLLGSSDGPSSVPCIIKHSSRSVKTILESSLH
jgi:hypothetical protein